MRVLVLLSFILLCAQTVFAQCIEYYSIVLGGCQIHKKLSIPESVPPCEDPNHYIGNWVDFYYPSWSEVDVINERDSVNIKYIFCGEKDNEKSEFIQQLSAGAEYPHTFYLLFNPVKVEIYGENDRLIKVSDLNESVDYFESVYYDHPVPECRFTNTEKYFVSYKSKVGYQITKIVSKPIYKKSTLSDYLCDSKITIDMENFSYGVTFYTDNKTSSKYPCNGKTTFDINSQPLSLFGYYTHINVDISLAENEDVVETLTIPPFYPNYPVDDEQLYVSDSKLHTSLEANDYLTMYSYFMQDENNRKHIKLSDLEDGYVKNTFLNGPYRLTFHRENYCTVERDLFVPEVIYNYVNGSDNVFWYEKEKRDAVTLCYKYPQYTNENFQFNFKTNNNIKPKKSKSTGVGKIEVYDLGNNGSTSIKDCMVDSSTFYTDNSLEKIDILIGANDKKFVPVHINLEKLKFYPKISISDTNIINAVCYYDTAIVKVSGMKGGLGKEYKFKLEKDGKEFWSENSTIKIPATIFGGNEQEVKLYVYDKDSISDDTGRLKRAFSKNIKFNYGEKLDIKNWQVADLKCFEDNTGKISITDWTPKNDDIKFEVWKSENKISESDITENLAAGDYNLKIIDGNKCENDSFQVTVNQPEKPLKISVDTVKNPVCFGYSNGRIVTHTTGGTQPYTCSWNNGSQDTAIYNLKAGTYILSVTDSHGCKDTATQELVDPEELQNSLTPSHTICKNGELKIDEGDLKSEDLHYSWLLPNGNVHNERVLIVKSDMPEGNYVMISQDTSGCFTADTTNIKFSDNELNIKFLAPTYSYLGDTVVLAEDSEVYKNFSWSYVFNEDMFTDITSSMSGAPYNHTFLESFKYGSDTITMYANDGRCNASYSKVVNILNEQRADYSDYNAPSAGIFTRLAIGPSYNDGNFTLFANLTEESELKMFILDLQRGIKIPLKYNSNYVSDHYAIPFRGLNLSQGVYALFITANGDTKYVKFTVK